MASPVKKLSPKVNSAERRAHDRALVAAASIIRGETDSVPVEVEIRDFSPSGCQFVAAISLPVGTRITIGLAGAGSATATVVRSCDKVHACLFDRLLPAADQQQAFTGTTVIQLASPGLPVPEDARWARSTRYRLAFTLGVLGWIGVAVLILA